MIFQFKNDSSFLWARLGGGLRCLLEFLVPLSLTDPFLLIKTKYTFKEKFSATKLVLRDNFLQVFGFFVFLPSCLVLAMSSPLFQHLTFIDGIKLSFSSEKLEVLDNRSDFSSFKHYSSESFKMSSFSSINSSKLKLIPSFEITREMSKKRIRPYLIVHDSERQVFGEIKLKRRFSIRKLIEIMAKHDPLFSIFYPELYKVLKRPTDHYSIKKYKDKFGDKKLLNPLARNELQDLIQSSYELSYKNLFSHLFSKGPFLSGHVRVRNYLSKLVDSDVESVVDLVKLGNYTFLRFKQSFKSLERGVSETYIPIETLNSAVIQMSWGSTRKDAFARNDFKEKFLNSTKWFFDYKGVFTQPSEFSDFNAFTIMDFFTLNNQSDNFVLSLQKYSFGHFFDLGKLALKNNDENLKNSVIASCNRILLLMSYKKHSASLKESNAKFIRMISDLKSAIINNNREFFEN
ncbi:hypothetical protein [Halobacteriovorax sp. HLS]|uniref:hypothetical protein n=1 Tax=Halobacteriovorax sp. HLS TaxID=2234000 RepID=UPI0013E3869F|nr:hypothetical protein [Halobacteriovorax sp. HLS]